jgi:uncharacterized protein YllA (UPF0747 family)
VTYRCTFNRIGRTHDVPQQDFVAGDAQELASAVYPFVRRFCASRGVEVITDLVKGEGLVIAGGRQVGRFTIEALT